MTDINLDLVQPANVNTAKKSKKTDAAAGPVLPAQPKYIEQALQAFELELPPIPQEKDLARSTPSSEQLLARARLLIEHGDKKNAAHLVRQALAIHSTNPAAMRLMIETLGEGEFARIEKTQLRRSLTRYQPNFENFFELAKLHYAQGNLEDAARFIENAFCFPTEDAQMLFEANKVIGNIEMQKGDFDAAEEFYHKAYSLNSRNASLLVNLGTLEVQRHNWDGARDRFSEAIAVCRGIDAESHVKALIGLFLVSRETEGSDAKLDFLQEALQINPGNRTAVHLFAHFSHQKEKHASAIPVLENYLDAQDFDEEMSLVTTQFYCLQGRYDEALLEAEKAALWNPGNDETSRMIEQINDLRKTA